MYYLYKIWARKLTIFRKGKFVLDLTISTYHIVFRPFTSSLEFHLRNYSPTHTARYTLRLMPKPTTTRLAFFLFFESVVIERCFQQNIFAITLSRSSYISGSHSAIAVSRRAAKSLDYSSWILRAGMLEFRNRDQYGGCCGPNKKYEETTILTRATIKRRRVSDYI